MFGAKCKRSLVYKKVYSWKFFQYELSKSSTYSLNLIKIIRVKAFGKLEIQICNLEKKESECI